MAFSSMALQGAGLFTQTVGAYSSAQGQKTALNASADVAEANARFAEMQAQATLEAGERDEQKSRLATAQLKSTQRTAMAANGVDLGTGSAARVLTSTDVMGAQDAHTIKINAIRAAFGARMEATNYKNEARTERTGAKSISPFGAAATTLLGGAGQLAGNWYSFKKSGAFEQKPKGLARWGAVDARSHIR